MSGLNRGKFDIIADILREIESEAERTRVQTEVGIPTNRCKAYLQKLENHGLAEKEKQPTSLWKITDKGRQFLEEYKSVRKIIPRNNS
ncbi:hypothetical protein AKJ56_01435 [candidate division MSBL1 archaeon SCGC-AAA382N08]|uniref:ArnR1-like winged helix-turn-helix domain-containing protein n=1 Tax=candidate division MSBL1 archaeon SCGC-AAA382N08 TaxID=1698285 RepID=A0A133VPM3_9EURY|nr:hypothetical protein AKJ56_01435 [candidate division MSBL1 archaeon SCGC-AAA382N08]